MKYCRYCGKELLDEAVMCPRCKIMVDGSNLKERQKQAKLENEYLEEEITESSKVKYCTKCGYQLDLKAKICDNCGCKTDDIKVNQSSTSSSNKSSTRTAANLFVILGAIFYCIYIVPILWIVPLTIAYFKKNKKNEKIGIGFKIAILLLVSVIGGVILLVEEDN